MCNPAWSFTLRLHRLDTKEGSCGALTDPRREGRIAAQRCQLTTCFAAADMEEMAPAERLQRSPEVTLQFLVSDSSSGCSRGLGADADTNCLQASGTTERDTDERDTDAEAASRDFAVAMAKLASDTKAGEISVLHVATAHLLGKVTSLTSHGKRLAAPASLAKESSSDHTGQQSLWGM